MLISKLPTCAQTSPLHNNKIIVQNTSIKTNHSSPVNSAQAVTKFQPSQNDFVSIDKYFLFNIFVFLFFAGLGFGRFYAR
jgi:hypothetical protein